MAINFFPAEYEVIRNADRCIACRVCERQCANEVHRYDADLQKMISDETKCVCCHRCVSLCPTRALKIVKSDNTFKENANWQAQTITEVYRQAGSGGVLLSSMGTPKAISRLLGQAPHQRFPGDQPFHRSPARADGNPDLPRPQKAIRFAAIAGAISSPTCRRSCSCNVPILFSAMSYGSISYNAHESPGQSRAGIGNALQHRRRRPA